MPLRKQRTVITLFSSTISLWYFQVSLCLFWLFLVICSRSGQFWFFIFFSFLFSFLTHTNAPSAIKSTVKLIAQLSSTLVLLFWTASVCTRDIEVFFDLAWIRGSCSSHQFQADLTQPITRGPILPSPFCFAHVPEPSCLPSSHLPLVFPCCLRLFSVQPPVP